MASMYYKEMFLENKLAKHSASASSVWPVAKLGGFPVVVDVSGAPSSRLIFKEKTDQMSKMVEAIDICLEQGI